MHGIGVPPNPEAAIEFFMKASRAVPARLEKHPGFGDKSVAANIEKAIAGLTRGKQI